MQTRLEFEFETDQRVWSEVVENKLAHLERFELRLRPPLNSMETLSHWLASVISHSGAFFRILYFSFTADSRFRLAQTKPLLLA